MQYLLFLYFKTICLLLESKIFHFHFVCLNPPHQNTPNWEALKSNATVMFQLTIPLPFTDVARMFLKHSYIIGLVFSH